MFQPCGNNRRKDSHGRFLLNARPKLNSNLNLNSKLICNQLSINDDMKFQIKDHELPIIEASQMRKGTNIYIYISPNDTLPK